MPQQHDSDDEAAAGGFERQAGRRQQPPDGGRRTRSWQRPGNAPSSSESSNGSWTDEEEEEELEEENLYPDVTVPTVEDVVTLKPEALLRHTPIRPSFATHPSRHDLRRADGFLLGIIEPTQHYTDLDIPDGYVPVSFSSTDDRYSAAYARTVAVVPLSVLTVLDRPLTVTQRVVANGRTGAIDDVEVELAVKPITFAPYVRRWLPSALADRLVIAAAPATPPKPPTSSRWRTTRHHHNKRNQQQQCSGHRVTLDQLTSELQFAPPATLLPYRPFRIETSVVNQKTGLFGMVTALQELVVVMFTDGAIAATSEAINDIDDLIDPDSGAEDHAVIVSRPIRIRREHSELLEFIRGTWDDAVDDDNDYRDGIIVAVLPHRVTCVYTANNGDDWDIGPIECAPSDLLIVDFYYTEFFGVLEPVFRLDPEMRRSIADEIAARCAAANVPSAEIIEEIRSRYDDFKERLLKLRQDPTGCIEQTSEVAVDPNLSTISVNPQVARHASRCSARDVPSTCGALTPLEFNVFYRHLYPPETQGAERSDAWATLLAHYSRLLPHLAHAKLSRTKVTVVWNTGDVDYRIDARTVVPRSSVASQVIDGMDPLEIMAPSAIRASTFPISAGANGRSFDEKVGEYDLQPLPEDHFTCGAGDIVMYKCRDDYDRDRMHGPPMELPTLIGQVFSMDAKDRLVTVRWTPASRVKDVLNRDVLPERSSPPNRDSPLVRAAAACFPIIGELRFGSVARVLPNGSVVVAWWDLHEDVVPQPELCAIRCTTVDEVAEADADAEGSLEGDEETAEDDVQLPENLTEAEQQAVNGALATHDRSATPLTWLAGAVQNVLGHILTLSASSRMPHAEQQDTTANPPAEAAEEPPMVDEPNATVSETLKGRFVVEHEEFRSHSIDLPPGFAPAEPTLYYKRIQSEWKLLLRDVPDGVIVKASEAQPHLLKIFVRGPMHTPYYQGIYLFDVLFPDTFPNAAPVVKFYAYGLRLNPNLYDNGYVCLSLLGTWSGRHASEEWNPTTSNMIQLILALQAMVLCKEPYYNEPGTEDQMGTERSQNASRLANEHYYLLKLEHTLKVAEAAPPDWAAEVSQHAREFIPKLLSRARGYLPEDDPTAAAAAPGCMNRDGLVLPLSRGFRASLSRALAVFERRYDTLRACWSDSPEHSHT